MTETVVLIPGIGMGGLEFIFLSRSLRNKGYKVHIFWKNPWRGNLTMQVQTLHEMLIGGPFESPHLVTHSFGGRVALEMLLKYPELRVGRVVMLGAPISGYSAVRRVLRLPGGRWILGEALASLCTGTELDFPPDRTVGSIAGRLNFLLGWILCPGKPNDTLVCVEETEHPQLRDHCTLMVSHTSMLASKQVNEKIIAFLRQGAFLGDGKAKDEICNLPERKHCHDLNAHQSEADS